jgi:hypothetical protein
MSKKKQDKGGDLTRRQFVKDTTVAVAGLAAGLSMTAGQKAATGSPMG